MENIHIEILEEKTTAEKKTDVALPLNFVTVGTVEPDSVRVYIHQDVYKKIEKFSKEDISKEVGSILLGQYVDEKDKKTVIISSFIEAKYTDASAATLTFTHETWDYVYKEKDRKHPDKVIVGWQHTHPGYGIFLSNYDIFIQENFFNLPWQVAYVVDPIADTRGFFEWKNGKVSKMSGFYVYDEVGKEIRISEKPRPARKPVSVSTVILSFLLLVSVILTVSFGMERNSVAKRLREAQESNRAEAELSQQLPGTGVVHDENTKIFKVYTVAAGDTLEKICAAFGLDYLKNIKIIMKINGIINADEIYEGQPLYLPFE